MSFDVDVATLARAIDEGTPPLIVDTRSRAEYAAGHVPGAVHLPFWRAASRHRELQALSDTHIVLYCGHGPRAAIARRALQRRGYRRIGVLQGHFSAWQRAAQSDG
jgi:rhodanese-related sulfurtransferase